MIHVYVLNGAKIERFELASGQPVPAAALWVDLYKPTHEEREWIGRDLALDLPNLEEMREIEPSDRLYQEGGASFMTATVIYQADDPNPKSDAITFILAGTRLVTLRHVDPRPIAAFAQRFMKHPGPCEGGDDLLLGILEAFVDRLADILERVGLDLDGVSRRIFDEEGGAEGRRDLRRVLKDLGRYDDLVSTTRESLLSLSRLLRFLSQILGTPVRKDQKARMKTLGQDLQSLTEHAAFESHKINFLLDATLGVLNIEQNNIIKLFSVMAVIFMPPTMIASIYGMNFRHMPELEWYLGYPLALLLMLCAAILPYWIFKRKGWL